MKVIDLADKSNNANFMSPSKLLDKAAERVEDTDKVLILRLNTINESYDISFMQCGMSMSECIALLEIAKTLFKKEMGY